MTDFTFPVTFASLAAGNQPLSDFDTNFDSSARMGTLMCSAVGTNTVTLTSLSNYPTCTAYGNIQKIGFIAANTTTSATTIGLSVLPQLNAYLNDGITEVGTSGNNMVSGAYYEYAYNSTLNSLAGGWQQIAFINSYAGILSVGGVDITSTVTTTNGMYLSSSNTPAISANSELVTNFSSVSSAVNYINFSNAATTGGPVISSAGSDSSIFLVLQSKGTGGGVIFNVGDYNQGGFFYAANTVNQFRIFGGATGSPPILEAAGSDTNINIKFLPQGSGNVQFGNSASFAANGSTATSITSLGPAGSHTTVQKWLKILDNSGNPFYIPCF